MVHTSTQPAMEITEFGKAYKALDKDTKRRAKENICATCEISEGTFYDWLKNSQLIKRNDRRFIAEVVFGVPVKTLFP